MEDILKIPVDIVNREDEFDTSLIASLLRFADWFVVSDSIPQFVQIDHRGF